jgi:hypothetical protein
MQDFSRSPLLRPRSVPMGSMQSKDCIIAVKNATQLAQQLMIHAGKVSCVITAFGQCQLLRKELGDAVFDGKNKDKVCFIAPTRALLLQCLCHVFRMCGCSSLAGPQLLTPPPPSSSFMMQTT